MLPLCHECHNTLTWKFLDDLGCNVLACPHCGETYRDTRSAGDVPPVKTDNAG